MASLKDLRKRITSVKTTQQTTKAMKMVSAAKLKRAQDAINAQKPYALRLSGLMSSVAASPGLKVESPLIDADKRGTASGEGKKLLLVLVSSDRGLCGAFNGNIIKGANRWLATHQANYASIKVSFVGKKAYDFFKTRLTGRMGNYYQELGGKVTFAKARKLSDDLIRQYMSGEFDEVKFVYNEFKNAVTQVTRVEDFLPLAKPSSAGDAEGVSKGAPSGAATQGNKLASEAATTMLSPLIKPDASTLFEQLLNKHFPVQAFRVMLESQAGEHGARMSAMENATKNAAEMIFSLTLEYNKQRQAGITKELLEIIAGSEAQKG